jgi:hypothetical protein
MPAASSDAEKTKLAFAQTVKVSPVAPVLPSNHEALPVDPAPATRREGLPHDVIATERTTFPDSAEAPPDSFDTSPGTARTIPTSNVLASIAARLQAPTRWQKRTWIGVLVATLSAFAVMIAGVRGKRSSAKSTAQVPATIERAAGPAEPAPREITQAPPSPTPLPPQNAAIPEPPAAAAATESPPAEEDAPEDLMRRGLGALTVHSTGTHASVYVMLKKYGSVEDKLLIPCGKRFIGIGVPVRDRKEPVWLAPGKSMEIPCGGSIETTMNPRQVK